MRENFSNCLQDFVNPDQVITSMAQLNEDNDVRVAECYGIEQLPINPGQKTYE